MATRKAGKRKAAKGVGVLPTRGEAPATEPPEADAGVSADAATEPSIAPPEVSWPAFIGQATDREIKDRFANEVNAIVAANPELKNAAVLAILRPDDSITSFDLDQIYEALMTRGPDEYKDVALILLSRGGEIVPAYQIRRL